MEVRLGEGGFGAVWLARDRFDGSELAIKLIPIPGTVARLTARRELAALRILLLPGVVRLLDDGEQDGMAWIAMERLHGRPFLSGRGEFEEVRASLRQFVATLVALHRLGIVHGDLKPANVLDVVDRGPVVLDFGIARGPGVEAEPSAGGGGFSLAYAAPEQIAGHPATVSSDVWAVGVMVFEYLSGWRIRTWRDQGHQPPLRALCPGLPATVADLLTSMLEVDPARRAPSAEPLLAALGGASPQIDLPPGARFSPSELAGWFVGPERLLHLPTDAARELSLRTSGERGAVALEIEAWERSGLALRVAGGWRVTRGALDRLAAGLQVVRADGTVGAAVVGAVEAAVELPAVLALARLDRRAGRRGVCRVRLQLGLTLARQAGDQGAVDGLLAELLLLAMGEERADQVTLALYAIERSGASTPLRESLHALGHAFRDHLTGNRAAAGDTASSLSPFEHDELECFRAACVVFGRHAGSAGSTSAAIAAWEPWSLASPLRRARWLGWSAVARYQEGDLELAARLHEETAALKAEVGAPVDSVLVSQYQAAVAHLEAGASDRARALAAVVEAAAAEAGIAATEANAVWVRRMAAYRLHEALGPDLELVEAGAQVSTREHALLASGEAVIAWRTGHPAAPRLLAEASRVFEHRGHATARLLFDALGWALGDRDPRGADRLMTELDAIGVPPGIRVQVLGLLVSGCPTLYRALEGALRDAAEKVPVTRWSELREILSVEEALGPPGGAP